MSRITETLRKALLGRENGIRRTLLRRIFGGGTPRDHEPPAAATPPPSAKPAATAPPEPPRSVTPPEGFEVVLHRDALADGQITEVIAAGKAIALARVDGRFYAVSNECRHAGGPIGDGKLDGHIVTCPYHGWRYDVRDGRCLVDADRPLPTYEVVETGSAVCVHT